MSFKITRRDLLKASGAALGGVVLSRTAGAWQELTPPRGLTQHNTVFQSLKPFYPGQPLNPQEMRISLLGTSVIERRAQARSSVFVELGNGEAFVFDCGSGVVSNYVAMKIPWSKMNKIFFTHLHGDHTSDATHIYDFGPQGDRKSPLFFFGPSRSGIRNPDYPENPRNQAYNPEFYEDGLLDFCQHFREMNRWHTESQSFVPTEWEDVGDLPGWPDWHLPLGDGYDIYATELDWKTGSSDGWWCTNTNLHPNRDGFSDGQAVPFKTGSWVAYERRGVKISFFPSVHGRNGALGYKLEWWPVGETEPLSMIFTGDTKPNDFLITSATEGEQPVDVVISEIVVDPEVWVSRQSGITDPDDETFIAGMKNAEAVQENSHTPQTAFGYVMRRMEDLGKAPRLAVGTHFQATDDTISLAMEDIRSWYLGPVTIAADLMVLRVTKSAIEQLGAVVSDYSWSAPWDRLRAEGEPKYNDTDASNPYNPMAPLAQFDEELLNHVINPCCYDANGWQCLNDGSPPCED